MSATAEELESLDPVRGTRLGSVALSGPEAVDAMIADAGTIQPVWAELPLTARARYLRRAAQIVIDEWEEIGELLVREAGVPRTEAWVAELLPAVRDLHRIAAHGERALAVQWLRGRRATGAWLRESQPVVGLRGTIRSPFADPCAGAALALMGGSAVLLHPDPTCALVGERIQAVFERAGVPTGLLRCLHGDVASDARVPEIAASAQGPGGPPAAALVLADAEIEGVVAGALRGAFGSVGRPRTGTLVAVANVAERVVDAITAAGPGLAAGDPAAWDTEVGPVPSAERLEAAAGLLEDAAAAGGRLGPIGSALAAPFLTPTVVTGLTPTSRLVREDAGAPVLAVLAAQSEREAVALAAERGSPDGASVWTADRPRAQQIARLLPARTVWLNSRVASGRRPMPPASVEWPGTRLKRVIWHPPRWRDTWGHPYDERLAFAARSWVRVSYGRDADKRSALRAGAGPMVRVAARSLPG